MAGVPVTGSPQQYVSVKLCKFRPSLSGNSGIDAVQRSFVIISRSIERRVVLDLSLFRSFIMCTAKDIPATAADCHDSP